MATPVPDRISLLLLVTEGAPAVEPIVLDFRREGFALGVLAAEAMAGGMPPEGVVLLWTHAGLDDVECERAVEWSRRRAGVGLVGCAPLGTSLDCERALAAGFDDFMAGRGSPRELAARIRSVARRITEPRDRRRVVATPCGTRHLRSGT